MAGLSNGITIFQITIQSLAPRSLAASSIETSRLVSRAPTVSITNEIVNVICAMITVIRLKSSFKIKNQERRERAKTNSGKIKETVEKNSKVFLSLDWDLAMAIAPKVPMMAAPIPAEKETIKLRDKDSIKMLSEKTRLYQSKENPPSLIREFTIIIPMGR